MGERYRMAARDSQDVAEEVLDLVYRFSDDPGRCTYLLATKLEVIYDYAFALGYKQGKAFAADYAYGLGFADGETSARKRQISHDNSKILLANNAEPKQLVSKTEIESQTTRRKKLYGLPCAVCGTFYIEEECPVCKHQNHCVS